MLAADTRRQAAGAGSGGAGTALLEEWQRRAEESELAAAVQVRQLCPSMAMYGFPRL